MLSSVSLSWSLAFHSFLIPHHDYRVLEYILATLAPSNILSLLDHQAISCGMIHHHRVVGQIYLTQHIGGGLIHYELLRIVIGILIISCLSSITKVWLGIHLLLPHDWVICGLWSLSLLVMFLRKCGEVWALVNQYRLCLISFREVLEIRLSHSVVWIEKWLLLLSIVEALIARDRLRELCSEFRLRDLIGLLKIVWHLTQFSILYSTSRWSFESLLVPLFRGLWVILLARLLWVHSPYLMIPSLISINLWRLNDVLNL